MGFLDDLFGGGPNPADAAKPYYDKIPGQGKKYYDPYINRGKEADTRLGEEYEKLLSDPTAFINAIMSQYNESAGYKNELEKLTGLIGNQAASGGIAGSPEHQRVFGENAQKLLSGDMQQFLQNILGRYDLGLKGTQGVSERGYGASGQLAELISQALAQQGNLAYQGQAQQNQNKSDIFSTIGKGVGTVLGGPIGGKLADTFF